MMEETLELKQQIADLKERNAYLEQHVKNLQESVGKWRRKAQDASKGFKYVAERHERGKHYISVPVTDVPADLTLHEIQEYVRDNVLPNFYPYRYYNVYTSKRHGGWVTTLTHEDETIDMDWRQISSPSGEKETRFNTLVYTQIKL